MRGIALAALLGVVVAACCTDDVPPGRDAGLETAPVCVDPDASCGCACGSNQRCMDGVTCKYTCTTDEDCLRIDARIPQCGPLGVCQGARF
jgi:hypothetical protein